MQLDDVFLAVVAVLRHVAVLDVLAELGVVVVGPMYACTEARRSEPGKCNVDRQLPPPRKFPRWDPSLRIIILNTVYEKEYMYP